MSKELLAEDNVALAAKLKRCQERALRRLEETNLLKLEILELERELKEQRETIKELSQ